MASLVLAALAGAAPASATAPNVPSRQVAVQRLAELVVTAESHQSRYSRDLFPLWITVSGTCNTREQVLKRDGTAVSVDASCRPTSGTWVSPYDGATWHDPADVDIDHMVPLAEAWRSGAWAWTTAQRQAYANDLGGPELWAVTHSVNEDKGDRDPATWQPPLASFRCTYARAWVQVKWYYRLDVDSAEKAALSRILDAC